MKKETEKKGYLDCCHIIIDDHGIKKEKVISTETLYEILKTSQVSTKRELFLGRMPTRLCCYKAGDSRFS